MAARHSLAPQLNPLASSPIQRQSRQIAVHKRRSRPTQAWGERGACGFSNPGSALGLKLATLQAQDHGSKVANKMPLTQQELLSTLALLTMAAATLSNKGRLVIMLAC